MNKFEVKSQVGIFPGCLFSPEFAVKRLGKNSFYMETEEEDEKNVLDYLKGKLKYENTVEAAEAKDRIRQIARTQTDDLPVRKAMWD